MNLDWTPGDSWSPFVYRAQVFDVIDGDTVRARLDLGFETYIIRKVRLRDIDTREISFVSHDSEEYERGMIHKDFAEKWVMTAIGEYDGDWPFIIKTKYDAAGSYGRVLGNVFTQTRDESLGQALYSEFEDVDLYD